MYKVPLALWSRIIFTVCLAILSASTSTVLAQFDFKGLGAFQSDNKSGSEVSVESQFTEATDDYPALLFVTAKIADNWHISALDQKSGGPIATSISVTTESGIQVIGGWQSVELPKSHIDQEIFKGLELREHYNQVTWFAPIEAAAGVDLASITISGQVDGQACEDVCVPFELPFAAKLGAGIALPAGVEFTPVENATPAAEATPAVTPQTKIADQNQSKTIATANTYDLSRVTFQETETNSLVYYLITAFLGGIILNIMPCVLPVIGLKVMSFVQQAGQSRAHALALNCWYAAGIVVVFLVLASLAVTLQLGWGGQFGNAGFNITLIAVVFAMALSLLGLWDIPIPGFVGSNTAMEAIEREGPAAAFLKGILTTLLATPCTGPFMATALAWAVKQPAWMTYSVFGMIGLGMASPYLVIGAFPNLVRFLPKPGAWMESFKKAMGLVLMATVVWLLTFIEAPLVVPTIALMVGITTACWLITQTPVTATFAEKVQSWVISGLLTVVVAMGSYGWLYKKVMLPRFEKNVAAYAEQKIGEERLRITHDLARIENDELLRQRIDELALETSGIEDGSWQRFSLPKLGHLTLGEGRTVLVDFTADWCLTCKTLEKVVLKTQAVEEALTQADVITMEADYTKRPEEIDQTIKALGGIGVPLIAIFPASDPYHPIVFSDGKYTKAGIIEAIEKATGRTDLQVSSNTADNANHSQASSKPRM